MMLSMRSRRAAYRPLAARSWTLDAYGLGFPDTVRDLYPRDAESAIWPRWNARWRRPLSRRTARRSIRPALPRSTGTVPDCALSPPHPASRQQQCRGHLVRHRSGRNAACRSGTAATRCHPCLARRLHPRLPHLKATEARALEALQEGCDFGALHHAGRARG
jgi:hypothetical protein